MDDLDCVADHSKLVSFDSQAAKELDPYEIRKRWPRVTCPECRSLLYASYEHYIAGDW